MTGCCPGPCGLTSSCSSSLSSSLTTGLARDPRLGRRRPPFSRSCAFSFRPSLIFTLTERAGVATRKRGKRDELRRARHLLGWGHLGAGWAVNRRRRKAPLVPIGECEPQDADWLRKPHPPTQAPQDSHSDSEPSSSPSSSSSLSSPSLSSSFSIFCRTLVKTDWRTMESS